MSTVIVWVLVSIGGYNNNTLSYSPLLADQASCEAFKKSIPNIVYIKSKCVPIKTVLK